MIWKQKWSPCPGGKGSSSGCHAACRHLSNIWRELAVPVRCRKLANTNAATGRWKEMQPCLPPAMILMAHCPPCTFSLLYHQSDKQHSRSHDGGSRAAADEWSGGGALWLNSVALSSSLSQGLCGGLSKPLVLQVCSCQLWLDLPYSTPVRSSGAASIIASTPLE